VSLDKRSNALIGNQDWILLQHEFVVAPGEDEKEMVCELRATEGEVWFDVSTLRLVRRP